MAGAGIGGGRTATLNLMVGIFLKLLGFFVVMYSTTEISPMKARQAEQSLAERFNIAVSLMHDADKLDGIVTAPLQSGGRAYRAIEDSLQTQVDFLSTERDAQSDTLVLRIAADSVLEIEGKQPTNANFADDLVQVLKQQNAGGYVYQLRMTVIGPDMSSLARALGNFAEKMTTEPYPASLVTIGYQEDPQPSVLEIRIKQVRG